MRIYLYLLLIGISGLLSAQTKFSKTPTKFMAEYKELISKTSSYSENIVLFDFAGFWAGDSLSKFHKKTFIKSIQQLSDKKQRPTPTLLQVGNILYTAASKKNATPEQLDTLVMIFKKISKDSDPKQIKLTLNILENYLSKNLLFEGKKHSIYVEGGNFDFSLLADASGGDFGDFGDFGSYEEEDETEEDSFDAFDEWGDESSEDDWNGEEELDEEVVEETQAEKNSAAIDVLLAQSDIPTLGGPILKLSNANLIIISAYDSVKIQNTSGSLSLTTGDFVGEEAKFDWSSAGVDNSVFATFKKYHLNIKKSNFEVEDVQLSYPEKVDGEMRGVFQYKAVKKDTSKPAEYPRFMTYTNDVVIKGLGDNIEYKGGFALNGPKVFSSCVLGMPSSIKVSEEGEVKFKALAKFFELTDSTFYSKPSSVVLYFAEGDSITHPGVRMSYNNSSKELSVRKDVTGYKEAPFLNSYHKLEMDVDQINWGLNDTIMNMTIVGAKAEVPAFYESELMFSEKKYIHLKSVFPFHPLQMIMNYSKKNKTKEFDVLEVAKYYNQKEKVVRTAVSSLSKKGLVKYNKSNGTAELTDKAMHYYFSRREKKDYDVISVKSLVPHGNNSEMNMTNYDLKVFGVTRVILSDSNDVRFYPADSTLIFKKNRDMLFDGKVTTNNYVFNGRDFHFSYDTFNLDLVHIDSIEFSIEVYDSATGGMVREKIDNKLSYSEGILTIDDANNKSGLKRNPRYPHFDADHGASVLFNKGDILNGVYDTTFRYQIPPFSVDSLSGDMENTISFDGEFYSGGVFPIIKQKLEVQNDRGFGFTHEVPEEGYPLFGSQAKFYGTITMGKNGLRGDGKITFLNTTLESMDFVFFKDSVKGLGDVANTIGGGHPDADPSVTFPLCNVTDYDMSWYPSKDSMHITNYENAFKLYNNEVDLSGALVITSKGMKGIGLVETHGSLTISKNILFRERSFSATEGQFEILSDVIGKPALRSDYVNVDIDLDKKQAWFNPSKEGYASNNFPYLKYRTSLNDGFWDIEKKIVKMEKPSEMAKEDSYFYSTKKSQDSLVFNAERAFYIIDSLKLLIEGVDLIRIADAIVYPDSNKLEIKENAKITTLSNAIIVMDTINEYHTLIDGEIDIKSRNDLDGHASYLFVNFQEDTIPINFSDFKFEALKNLKGETEYHTVAKGTVLETDTFLVAPQMLFKGDATMFAHRRLLSLDGFIKLDLHGNVKTDKWLRYENSDDEDEIRIDLESQENKNNLELVSGIHYSSVNHDYYCTFLGEKQNEDDESIFDATGYLIHDLETKEFEVIDKNRLDKQYFTGNLFGYIEEQELYDVNGRFEFINHDPEIPHHYTFDFGGTGENNILDSTFDITGLGRLKFEIPKQIYDIIGEKIGSIQKYLPPNKTVRLGDSLYHAVGDISGNKNVGKFVKATERSYVPLNKVVKSFTEGIIMNDLELVWDKEHKAWHSIGPVGLINIGTQSLNMFTKSYFEIKKTPEEDQINLYIEATPDVWYYFSYSGNALYILTSHTELETYVSSKNTETKNLPKGLYYWTGGDQEDLSRFKRRFIRDYFGGKDIEIDYSSIPQQTYETSNDYEDNESGEKDGSDEFEDEFEDEFDNEDSNPKKIEDSVDDEFEEESEVEDNEFEEDKTTEPTPNKKDNKKKDKKSKKKKTEEIIEDISNDSIDDEFESSDPDAEKKEETVIEEESEETTESVENEFESSNTNSENEEETQTEDEFEQDGFPDVEETIEEVKSEKKKKEKKSKKKKKKSSESEDEVEENGDDESEDGDTDEFEN